MAGSGRDGELPRLCRKAAVLEANALVVVVIHEHLVNAVSYLERIFLGLSMCGVLALTAAQLQLPWPPSPVPA